MKTLPVALLLLMTALIPGLAHAQQGAVQPAYINGTIAVQGETVTNVSISASFTYEGVTYSASTHVADGSTYSLTVNVPVGVAFASYELTALAYLGGGNYVSPPAWTVDVAAGETKTEDALVVPGYIAATVTAESGTLDHVSINLPSGSADSVSGALIVAVTPGPSVYLSGTAVFEGDAYVELPSTMVSVEPGQTVAVSWSVAAPPPEN